MQIERDHALDQNFLQHSFRRKTNDFLAQFPLQDVSYSVRGRVTGFWQGSFAVGQFLSGMVVTLDASRVGGLLQSMVVIGEILMVWAVLICSKRVRFQGWSATGRKG